jgi:exopolysaccharide biosynthesis protein
MKNPISLNPILKKKKRGIGSIVIVIVLIIVLIAGIGVYYLVASGTALGVETTQASTTQLGGTTTSISLSATSQVQITTSSSFQRNSSFGSSGISTTEASSISACLWGQAEKECLAIIRSKPTERRKREPDPSLFSYLQRTSQEAVAVKEP